MSVKLGTFTWWSLLDIQKAARICLNVLEDTVIDDYAKDGGPGGLTVVYFYHEPLRN